MKKCILIASIISLIGSSSFASEWNNFYSSTDESEYFFDAESVIKTKDDVTLWVKTVQKHNPDSDGSWSTALNWKVKCEKRTLQVLSSSTYDSSGKFIKSSSAPSQERSVIPDSVGSGIHKAVCMADFPRNTPATKSSYFKVEGNDIFAATKDFVEYAKSKVDNAPK